MTAVKEGDLIEAAKGEVRVIDRAVAAPASAGLLSRLILRNMHGMPFVDRLADNGWTVQVLESAPPTDFGTVLSFSAEGNDWWTYVCAHDGSLIPLAPTVEEDIRGRSVPLSYVLDTRGRRIRVVSRPTTTLVNEVIDEVRKRAIAEGSDSITVRRLVLENIAFDLGGAA